MGITIKVSKDLEKLLKQSAKSGLSKDIARQFERQKSPVKIKRTIVQDMIRGISPVKGGGKWKKYSESYKDQIRGKAAFRTINGKVVPFSTKGTRGRGRNKIKDFINALNKDFIRSQSPTKRISPVNLRLSGGLHRSLRVFVKGGLVTSRRLIVEFKSFLADIHNRLGAGKKAKVIRRLLPTKSGERFNRRIEQAIIFELNKAVNKIVK